MKVVCKAGEIMERKKIKPKWLSKKTKMSLGHIYDIINNRRNNVYVECAYKISHALGKKIEDVFDFIE
ncbi:MAG: helix-turn-helix domain-containing protein [archaeon]